MARALLDMAAAKVRTVQTLSKLSYSRLQVVPSRRCCTVARSLDNVAPERTHVVYDLSVPGCAIVRCDVSHRYSPQAGFGQTRSSVSLDNLATATTAKFHARLSPTTPCVLAPRPARRYGSWLARRVSPAFRIQHGGRRGAGADLAHRARSSRSATGRGGTGPGWRLSTRVRTTCLPILLACSAPPSRGRTKRHLLPAAMKPCSRQRGQSARASRRPPRGNHCKRWMSPRGHLERWRRASGEGHGQQ